MRAIGVLLPLFVCVHLLAADEMVTSDEIQRLVAELGHSNYVTREAAMKRLLELGEKIVPHLEAASDSSDPEVRIRARQIMARVGGGDVDNVDAEILREVEALIELVMGSGHENLDVLVQSGKRVVPSLVKICRGNDQRKAIYSMIALTRIADPRSFPTLAALFQHSEVRKHMSGYVGQIEDPRMLFHLIRVWQQQGENASPELQKQVRQMSSEDLGNDPAVWMKWFMQKYGEQLGNEDGPTE